MSPKERSHEPLRMGFPRVSGDEPDCGGYVAGRLKFSPRERG